MGFASRIARLRRELPRSDTVAAPIIASDFVRGGRADFGRLCSAKGDVVEIVRRDVGESHDAFLARASRRADRVGAPRLVIGGIDPDFDPGAILSHSETAPRGAIALPDGGGLHHRQAEAARMALDRKRLIIRAGRRFGKTATLIALGADQALRGRPVGFFTPLHKIGAPTFDALVFMLAPFVISKNRSVGEIRLSTGGNIDVWSFETSTIIARGRKYALALLDEIAHVKGDAMGLIWRASISPTLVDLDGSVVVSSTPWGTDPSNWFFQICSDKTLGWTEIHARSADNPFLPRSALEEEKRTNSPLVWRQEFEAEFVSLDSAALIDVTKLLQPDGEPWPEPPHFEFFFAVVDSAIKTGAGADGCAVLYCAIYHGQLYLLDYDLVQVSAGVLEPWFDGVMARAQELTGRRTIRVGPIYVEDASSGPILIEKYPQRAEALPHQWASEGKDLRAYAVQSYFNGGRVRLTEASYLKTIMFKGVTMNHLVVQLNSFTLSDKDAHKRSDDLLDAAVYATSIAFRPRPVAKR
jgi:hypothetical protein